TRHVSSSGVEPVYDFLIRNAKLVDGTGNPWYRADVGVRDGRIAAIGRLAGEAANRLVEADGRVLCPGFVDAHVHGDTVILGEPAVEAAVRRGVTTFLLGQGGL